MPTEVNTLLREGLSALSLDPERADVLEEYLRLLLEKNEVMNLTAITDPAEAARRHMLDSACLLSRFPTAGKTVLDVGTGAGFPGLVLRLCEPATKLTLLDSLGKRVSWLAEVSAQLGAPDTACIHARAEELSRTPEHREQYDLVVSRSVAEMRVLSELCLPYVKPGGLFVAMKSAESEEELAAARGAVGKLGGRFLDPVEYTIPGTDLVHRLVVVEKRSRTPGTYPRKFARIKSAPL